MPDSVLVQVMRHQLENCGIQCRRDLARDDEFEVVAMPHTEILLRVALRLTGDRELAEDLVQETAWRSFHRLEPETNCKAWLFKIMLNHWSNCRRSSYRQPQVVSLDEGAQLDVAEVFSPARFTSAEILAALDAISEHHRAVLMLAVVKGFTCREIVQILDIPLGTVLSRISRAKAALRARLIGTQTCANPTDCSGRQSRRRDQQQLADQ